METQNKKYITTKEEARQRAIMESAQDLINEIEREEEVLKNYKQDKPRSLNIEVLKSMTIGQIKQAEEFFKIQAEQEQADLNLSECVGK